MIAVVRQVESAGAIVSGQVPAESMPLSQTVTFSSPVRTIEVVVTLGPDVWIDDFHVNPP